MTKLGGLFETVGNQTQTREPFDLRCIPETGFGEGQLPTMNSLGDACLGFAAVNAVSNDLQFLRNLPGEHFDRLQTGRLWL